MDYLFIDESGDINLNGSKYLIIAGLFIKKEYKSLDNIIKKMRQNKFSKQLNNINELKGSEIPQEITIHSIKMLNKKIKYNSNIIVSILTY